MKNFVRFALTILLVLKLVFCTSCESKKQSPDEVKISLSDVSITVNGETAGTDSAEAVYVGNDIVYYESGKDFTYGEGTENDAHSATEAAEHTVVHITKAGVYRLSGELSKGQIAVDLGKDAKKDPEAVVTLILDGVDITCSVAPAVIFYNVYECGNDDADTATKDVDTSAAGANVIIADGTVNNVVGSYVARIYDPESVVLNEDKTEVEDADKLHKYDAAFYSKRSMNVNGEKNNTGILNITAENEGLDSELHLTINGGNINILSGNDGINTNEDGVSVTTINGGNLKIKVTGETGEGDGIDSNGWLVINGGSVTAYACSTSGDAGIDSDMGIHINGGTVVATGNMLDRISEGGQTYAVFNFVDRQMGEKMLTLKDSNEKSVFTLEAENDYSILIYSSAELTEGKYTLWSGDTQLSGQKSGMGGMHGMGGMRPEGGEPPSGGMRPEGDGGMRPEGGEPPSKETMPEGEEPPIGEVPPDVPDGFVPEFPNMNRFPEGEASTEFIIEKGENNFNNIS